MPLRNSKAVKRERLSPISRILIAYRQKYKCMICKELLDPRALDIDHIKSLHKGGGNEFQNLQALCKNCHGRKTFSECNKSDICTSSTPAAPYDSMLCKNLLAYCHISKKTNTIALTFKLL